MTSDAHLKEIAKRLHQHANKNSLALDPIELS